MDLTRRPNVGLEPNSQRTTSSLAPARDYGTMERLAAGLIVSGALAQPPDISASRAPETSE
ncbi:hypothetical protein Tdes44962_MAKER05578 [Teratosphaeria destructans]|uniref:Uncharacterized protein n=1 Tax=Teratosphaeria destructans TaxID=418781 RepID=A0A9W7SJW9_9PEZI|nr:hypothetical protein Tdes44962_MAKER05578 [Teratosphaeria destructans]